jgi:CubicO group peptidase (beta-lactamase class C family)
MIAQVKYDLDEFIENQMELHHVPGLSACIILEDSVYWNNNYGYMNLADSIPVNDSTLFNAFSIGKSITTSCVMQLWDDGILGLDQSINDIIPFYIINTRNDQDSISPRMLMSHTSSLKEPDYTDYFVYGDPNETLASFLENYYTESGNYYSTLNFSNNYPGTWFHYCNHAIGLLGYLVEPLTGLSFSQYAQDSLLDPLEMKTSAWFLNELDTMKLATGYEYVGGFFSPWGHLGHPAYPGMMLRTTALELANYDIMLLNRGVYKGVNILSGDAVDSMCTVQDPYWSTQYGITGLGMFQREDLGNRMVWGHNGGSAAGYAAHLYFCEEENSGVVIMTNSEQYLPDLVEYLFDYALSIQTGIPDDISNKDININIYPNPAKDRINIQCDQHIVELFIYSLTGKEILIEMGNTNIDISTLPSGIYILEARTEEGIVRQKFVKR